MPILNDMARCDGEKVVGRFVDERTQAICEKRETCARYVERNTGGPRTPHHHYLCDEGDMYIPAEKPNGRLR